MTRSGLGMALDTLIDAANDTALIVGSMIAPASSPPRVSSVSSPAVTFCRQVSNRAGVPVVCVDLETAQIVGPHEVAPFERLNATATQWRPDGEWRILEHDGQVNWCARAISNPGGPRLAAVAWTLTGPDARPDDWVLAAADAGWSQQRFVRWLAAQQVCSPDLLRTLLCGVGSQLEQEERAEAGRTEIRDLRRRLESTYEEVELLHSVTRNLQISRSPVELAEMCLNRMHSLIGSQGSAIWIEEKNSEPRLLLRGSMPLDEVGMARLIARFDNHDWTVPLVKNRIDGTLLGADFPGLRNVAIVPIAEGSYRAGWILSCNHAGNREFGTVESSLLNSIATILGTHLHNLDLYSQYEELLVGFVKSLVSTLDAKDPYTRGHSERVALIGRRLGEEFHLPAEDLHDIYVAGLLHDVGKIGVDDRILQKPGKLTDEEFKKIQEHPVIGYNILKGLRNLQKVLPGVRSHHETYSGRGYPDGLVGEDIPLMARILAVADSFDAMHSDRPYRAGMSVEKIEDIFRRGAGDQWDRTVIDAYFSARTDIHAICREYSLGQKSLLGANGEASGR